MNKVTVEINGMEYNLKGEENREYLINVANYVDSKIKNLIDGNKKLSTASSAILTAMNSVDEMFKARDEAKEIKNQFALLKSQISYLERHNKELEDKVEGLETTFNLKIKENTHVYENKIKNLEGIVEKNGEEILSLKKLRDDLKLEIQDKNIILEHREESLNNLQEEIHKLEETYRKEKSEIEKNCDDNLAKTLEEKKSMEISLVDLENNLKETNSILEEKSNSIEKLKNEKRVLLKENEGKDREVFNLKKEKSILEEIKLQLTDNIRDLEGKFKDYEENNSYKDKVESLSKQITILEEEAKKYKKLNEYLKEKSKETSFTTSSNFYKLKTYQNKYIVLIEELIESQIRYICLNEDIEYIPPMDIERYIENNDDFDIEEEVNFMIRNGQRYPSSLKNKAIRKMFTA
ncbi:cell division protein ZapA [Clostridium hydrogeniformans]|uniref:cell division protein ZapA n=1 Tax=Clostridium hydrogeniformans TaxID=349933 RepID=UPI000484043F|nr:cell division protein ZapA [Clostridium hydrogeniformans]